VKSLQNGGDSTLNLAQNQTKQGFQNRDKARATIAQKWVFRAKKRCPSKTAVQN